MTNLPPRPGSAEELAEFSRLQRLLPEYHRRLVEDPDAVQTLVVAGSTSLDSELMEKVTGRDHYEERMLAMLLFLRRPRTNVVFCSSKRIPESILDYYLSLLAGIPSDHAMRRLTLVPCDDGSPIALAEKLLQRPRRLNDIRAALQAGGATGLVTFFNTPWDRSLAVQLGVPLYGNDPALADLGTKSGSREAFRAAAIDLPDGQERLCDMDDVVSALADLKGRNQGLRRAVVKLEEGFSGEGNAIFSYEGIEGRGDAARKSQIATQLSERLRFVAHDETWEEYSQKFTKMGGIVEEFLDGSRVRSPSAQLVIEPDGSVDSVSTHDQILGGADGQVYEGSTFPADLAYRRTIAEASEAVGAELSARGARGRFAVDFVVLDQEGKQRCAAIEVNLRMGGTTYPMLTLELLTAGRYNRTTGEYISQSGRPKVYLATDNLAQARYRGLSPEDLIDLAVTHNLHYDARTESGVVFHMMGALSEFGKIGLTCIADTAEESQVINERVIAVLDEANNQ